MVNLPCKDGTMWNLDEKIIEILKEYQDTGQVDIVVDSEGPDLATLGLYKVLDKLVDTFNMDPGKISILTHNQLETHNKYNIKKGPALLVRSSCIDFAEEHLFPEKTFDRDFKTFGLFVGRLNWLRLSLVNHVHTNHKEHSIYTCHFNKDIDYYRPHISMDSVIRNNQDWDTIKQCIQTLSECPFKVDELDTLPILTPSYMHIAKIYHKFFIEIVAESFFSGTVFYPTEKVFRPIALKTPFIVQGPKHFLSRLKLLGFQTFDRWWDEGYSEDPYNYQIIEIKSLIDRLSKLSTTELQQMYIEMQGILENNYQCLKHLKSQDFEKAFGYKNHAS